MSVARVLRSRATPFYRLGRATFEAVAAALPPWRVPPIPGPVGRADLMLRPSLVQRPPPRDVERYLVQGRQAVDHLVASVAEAGTPAVRSILDVGCGHGRVLRHLPEAFPGARIVGVDTDRRAAAFCRRHLGVEAGAVDADPATLPPGPFDLIWLGSVVTHLDRGAVEAMVGATGERLAPGGVLALTTLAPDQAGRFADIRATGAVVDPAGLTYVPYPHSADGSYGLSFVAPATVRALVPLELVRHIPQGWDGLQDLWAFRRPV